MEFDLIPQIIIIIASGVIIVILGRNIPKLKDDSSDGFWSGNYNEVEKREKEKFQYLFDRLKKKINRDEYKKRIDLFWIWFEKLLRKVRINFLKVDNTIVMVLEKLREKNIEKIEKIFKDTTQKAKSGIQKAEIRQRNDPPKEEKKFDWNSINRNAASAPEMEKKKIIEAAISELETGDPAVRVIKKEEVSANPSVEEIVKESSVQNFEIHEESPEKFEDAEELVENLGGEERTNKEKEYINMILKNPIDVKAYWQLGTIYVRRKNYKDAIECFRQITKIDPTYDKAKHKLAEILGKMKKGVKRGKKNDKDEAGEDTEKEETE